MWQQEFLWFFTIFHQEFRKNNPIAFEVLMVLAVAHLFGFYNPKQLADFREFSRDHKSSEQFVWLNRRHREMETQLAHSSVAFDDTNSASGGVDLGSFSGYGLPWVV